MGKLLPTFNKFSIDRHCICHNSRGHLLTIGTARAHCGEYRGIIRFLRDEAPYDDLHQKLLEQLEYPLCCSVVRLDCFGMVRGRPRNYVAAGTAFAASDELEAMLGRIIIFDINVLTTTLSIVMIAEINGAVYDVAAMNTSHLVCAVNHAVNVYLPSRTGLERHYRAPSIY